MKGNATGYFLGRALAAIIVMPLAYYFITLFFDKPNKVTKAIIHQYMADSIVIKDTCAIPYSPLEDEQDSLGKRVLMLS